MRIDPAPRDGDTQRPGEAGATPRHVAVIMDGNGRWATRRGLPRTVGHRAGAKAVSRVVEAARRRGIGTLTLFAFSADNWRRPEAEVEALMGLFERYLAREARRCAQNGIRLRVIGRRDRLALALVRAIEAAEAFTASGEAMELRIAVDYSGRDAILEAMALSRRRRRRRGRRSSPRSRGRARAGRRRWTSSCGPAASTGSATSSSGRPRTPRSSSRPVLAGRGGCRARRGPRLVLRAGAAVRRPALDRAREKGHGPVRRRRDPCSRRRVSSARPAARPGAPAGAADAAPRPPPQPLLPEGPARELRQARPHADARAHERRGGDARRLGGSLLGREPPPGAAAARAVPAGRRDHRPPDVRAAGLRARPLVPRARRPRRPRRPPRLGLPRRGGRRTPTRSRSATACRSGRGSSPTPRAGDSSPSTGPTSRAPYRDAPPPRRDLLPRESFLTTASLIATRGCHNRCDFCYLSTARRPRPVRACRTPEQVVAEWLATGEPYAVFLDNNLGSRPGVPAPPLPRAARRSRGSGARPSPSTSPTIRASCGRWRSPGCTGVFVGFESLSDANLADARKKTPPPPTTRGASGSFTTTASR